MTYGDGPSRSRRSGRWRRRPTAAILAGVEPAGLFRSDDGGATWRHVEGLTNHRTRPTWEPGAGGLILHTIIPHPTDTDRTWVGISAVGVFETRDGGTSWEPRNVGVRAEFNPEDRFPETGQCVHKFAMAAGEPETLYQRNHCGVYRSDDGSATWQEITGDLPTDFGFSMVTHPRDPATCLGHPAQHARRGPLHAGRRTRRSGGRTTAGRRWICADAGLPKQDAYMSVLREAMARDTLDPVGVTFGTATGQLWHSSDEGEIVADDHRHAARDLGRRGRRRRGLGSWRRSCCRARSCALFPGVEKRNEVAGATVGELITRARRLACPGCATGWSRPARGCGRTSTSSSTGEPADLATAVAPGFGRPRAAGGKRRISRRYVRVKGSAR